MGESAVGLSVPASPPAPADGITWPVLGATKYTWQTEGAPKEGEKKASIYEQTTEGNPCTSVPIILISKKIKQSMEDHQVK